MTTKVSLAIHPGEHIADELAARGMTAADLARAMGVDAGRVSRLVEAQVSVTGDTAIRLGDAFGTCAEFWMRLQGDCDLARAREERVAQRADVLAPFLPHTPRSAPVRAGVCYADFHGTPGQRA
jgi:antitoxin HigA-1